MTSSHNYAKRKIYMWNDSHRISTEHWQKTQTSERAIKSPHNQGGQKKKEGEKDQNGTCAPGRDQQGEPLGQRGSFPGGERRTCCSRRIARDRHRWSAPRLCAPGLRHTSTGASRDCRLELGLQRANLGTGPGLAVQKQPEGAGFWCDCSQQGMQREPEPATVVIATVEGM